MIFDILLLNLTLLVSISIVSGFMEKRWARQTRLGMMLQGALFGAAAVVGMLHPLHLGAGMIFDGRSVMLSVCALFYGPWAGAVAGFITSVFRIGLGGVGAFTGVLIIIASIIIGLQGFSRLRPAEKPPSTGQLYLFGFVVHVVMLALLFTLPGHAGLNAIERIGLPVMLLYPLATVLVGKILADQVRTLQIMADLGEAEQNLSITLQSIGDGVIATDLRGAVAFMNPVAEALTGWSQVDACGKPFGEVFHIVNETTRDRLEDPVNKVLGAGKVVGLANHTVLIAKDGVERPIADSAAPIRDAQGRIGGVVLVFRDQSEQRLMNRLIRVRLTLLEYATNHSLKELLTKALDEAGALIESPLGFYHFVEEDQQTLLPQSWSTLTMQEFCQAEGRGTHCRLAPQGLWADCLQRKEPVVHNDCSTLLQDRTLPAGHPQVVRELVVPIIRENRVVAMVGMGNKPTDYTAKDVEIISYLADVTWHIIETKRAEEALRENETLFRNLFEYHAAVKLIYDPETGHILDANRAAEDYYGWPKEQLRQMSAMDINTLPPEQIKAAMADARALRRVYFEFQHRRADGSVRDVEVFSSRIDVKGRDLLHTVVHDVTERKQAEQKLQESEVKYRELFENAPIGIFATTSGGQVLSINTTMANILGFDSVPEAMKNYPDLQQHLYVDPARRDQFLQMLQETGRVENFEYQARTADDRIVWLNMNARIAHRKQDGSFVIEGFTTDITAQRKLEEQFRQAQKMESVGRLAGGVAHDYNNMLSVIVGYAELALDQLSPSDTLYDDLQEILKAARRSTQVTRQLLAFARKQTIAPKVIDLNETIEGMLKMLRRLIGEDIDLAWRPAARLWPVKMDPSQIDQILANLCVNARDAIAGVGRITIETGTVTFDQAYCDDHPGFFPGRFVLLAASDDGCGMDKATREKLFEPFFTTKDVGRGTGLGLATVYGIVKQNDGFINVYSEPGKGTTFKIYLRRHHGEAVDSPPESAEQIPLSRGETVLIVEDEVAILTLSKIMLERLGYTVLSASSAGEALQLAEKHGGELHLFITDVVMPEMNGRELADQLYMLHPGIRTLFMSGYTANVIAHQGVLDEGVCFIQKPFSLRDLAVKVREALQRS